MSSAPTAPATLEGWVRLAERAYARAGVALGQVAADAHDEALFLFLRTLGRPLEAEPGALRARLTAPQRAALARALRKRVAERVPAAYLVREMWLAGRRFYVDERAIIPRSYLLEIIPKLRAPPGGIRRIADVGTGSGCLAVLLARRFPAAAVDAIDVSAPALQVAAVNVREHRLSGRVRLRRSDVFDALPPGRRYDLIVSNPPYEPSGRVDRLPPEFRREPRRALDGGRDGLDVIRKLLAQAGRRLEPGGFALIEVGGLRRRMEREFAGLGLRWLRTRDGTDCVCRLDYRPRS